MIVVLPNPFGFAHNITFDLTTGSVILGAGERSEYRSHVSVADWQEEYVRHGLRGPLDFDFDADLALDEGL